MPGSGCIGHREECDVNPVPSNHPVREVSDRCPSTAASLAQMLLKMFVSAQASKTELLTGSYTRRFTTACSSGSRDSLLRLPGRYTHVQTPTHRHTHK